MKKGKQREKDRLVTEKKRVGRRKGREVEGAQMFGGRLKRRKRIWTIKEKGARRRRGRRKGNL